MMALCAGPALIRAQTNTADNKRPAAPANATADELKQIEQDWVDAIKARNAERVGDILAESWVGIGWDGKTANRAKVLADLNSAGNSLDTIEMGPIRVRTFGNVAVVTGSDTEKSKQDGKDTSGKYIWTDVFVKQNGKWKAVSSQMTKLPK
jgi:ketosteroid isomerase-like protein